MANKFKEKINTWAAPIGGIPGLAARLKIKRQAIYQWDEIPTKRIVEIEKITGVDRSILRPDLYKKQTISPTP